MLFSFLWHSWNDQNAIKSDKRPFHLRFDTLYLSIPFTIHSKYIIAIFYNTKSGSNSQYYKSCLVHFAIYLIKKE